MNTNEFFMQLETKYGEDFNWILIHSTKTSLIDELIKELGNSCTVKPVRAIAKCMSNDDVLFLMEGNSYHIYHLTYSMVNLEGYPKYIAFDDIESAIGYIEQDYIENYL